MHSSTRWSRTLRALSGGSADNSTRDPRVLEPDRRLVIAALSIGVIVGALLTPSKSADSTRAAAATSAKINPD